MSSTHISDEKLQGFLLNDLQDDAIGAHLAACPICREKLDAYQYVIDNAQKIEAESFSFDVTTLAMNTVMQYEQQKNKEQAWVFWGIWAFVSIVIVSCAIPFVPAVLAVFNSKSIFTTLLVLGTGVLVLVFLLVDIVREYGAKARTLDLIY
jgi:amino acid transporter